MPAKQVLCEDQIPSALDKCIADTIIKVGSGVVTGGALSLVLFRRRLWPITLGIGIGTGMAMANCQNKLNSTDVVRVSSFDVFSILLCKQNVCYLCRFCIIDCSVFFRSGIWKENELRNSLVIYYRM
ncbi:unnamed protein product [Orchesella dallaii]|uniref:MICOS complex subunit MIC10 n=1 Tax=Orchesella dallaii TaxID=48710 RepID=A0ABP1S612_9HEXA